jgi:hypothetical protein
MRTEVITRRDDLLIRRQVLEPGEASPWHIDVCRRFTVVVRGQRLDIEFGGDGERVSVEVAPGLADWDEPDSRVHRAINSGETVFEEVVVFFLEPPGVDPQPEQT